MGVRLYMQWKICYALTVLRCPSKGHVGGLLGRWVVDDHRLCLSFKHARVSARFVLQLARLTDGYHSLDRGL